LQPKSAPIIEKIMRAGVTSHNQIVAKLNERNVNTARGANRDTSEAASRQLSFSIGQEGSPNAGRATQVMEGLFSERLFDPLLETK
jgi:hypothetical protein